VATRGTTQLRTVRLRPPWRLRRAGVVSAALAAIGLLAAACGGGSASPRVANLGSTTTAPASSAVQGGSNATNDADGLAFAGCMRTHGVPNFPDPTSSGGLLFHGNPNSSQFASANNACQHLLPNGGKPSAAETQQKLTQALKHSQCMRSHGVPNFPDPEESNGFISLRIAPGVDPNSPQYQSASSACKQYTPGGVGLPAPGRAAAPV
jgi:hypothetical protein